MQTGSMTMATEGIGHGCQIQAILLRGKKLTAILMAFLMFMGPGATNESNISIL